MLIAIHFARLGPYHLARLRSACDVLIPMGWRVVALEIAGTDSTYEWDKESLDSPAYERVTVFPDSVFETISATQMKKGIARELNRIRPDAMAIAGWGTSDARACLDWCKSHGAIAIVMSETRTADGRRVWWKEWLKSRIVRQYDAALCGGDSHKQYLMDLGIPAERIKYGYNVVDNHFFHKNRNWGTRIGECTEIEGVGLSVSKDTESIEVEGKVLSHGGTVITEQGDAEASLRLGSHAGDSASDSMKSKLADLPVSESLIRYADGPASLPATSNSLPATAPEAITGQYFLASNRFVERKNLGRLIRAYAIYVVSLQEDKKAWPLVLLGDGELRGELEALCKGLELKTVMGFSRGDAGTTEEEDLKLNSYKLKTSPGGGCVLFAGFRQIAELPTFYADAGAFIHPALSEPWGLVINEAMASGLPILSSNNVGAAEELVIDGETGYLFDPMDLQAISAAMQRIADMPEDRRQQMGESARALVEKKAPMHGFGNGLKALLLQK
jgi:glycosyltransferase involved in cell wall biosynthesis